MSALWLVTGIFYLSWMSRLHGDRGRARFDQLSEDRARGAYELICTRRCAALPAVGAIAAALDTVVRLVRDDPWGAAFSAAAAMVFLAAAYVRKLVEPDVSAAMVERGLEPDPGRETSARRLRRQKQFGFTSLAAYTLGSVALILGDRNEVAALVVLGGVATTAAFAALLGLAWAGVWVYGDEEKAQARSRD